MEVILTEIPGCLAPRVAEEVVQNRPLRFVQLAGQAAVTIVQKKLRTLLNKLSAVGRNHFRICEDLTNQKAPRHRARVSRIVPCGSVGLSVRITPSEARIRY